MGQGVHGSRIQMQSSNICCPFFSSGDPASTCVDISSFSWNIWHFQERWMFIHCCLQVCATIWQSLGHIGHNRAAWCQCKLTSWRVNTFYGRCLCDYPHYNLRASRRWTKVFLKEQFLGIAHRSSFLLPSKRLCPQRWTLGLKSSASEIDFGAHSWLAAQFTERGRHRWR